MIKLFDSYSYKAIHLPTLIILSSLIVNIYFFLLVVILSDLDQRLQWLETTPPKLVVSLIPILVYFISVVMVRTNGRKLQRRLITFWDGLPSTRFLRFRDPKFSRELKVNIKNIIRDKFNIGHLDETEESDDPAEADRRIVQSFELVKDWLRIHDSKKFWQIHNTDYGFYRNLWGNIKIFHTLNTLVVFLALGTFLITKEFIFMYLTVFNIIFASVTFFVIKSNLTEATKISAEQYSESAWMTFYNLNNN